MKNVQPFAIDVEPRPLNKGVLSFATCLVSQALSIEPECMEGPDLGVRLIGRSSVLCQVHPCASSAIAGLDSSKWDRNFGPYKSERTVLEVYRFPYFLTYNV